MLTEFNGKTGTPKNRIEWAKQQLCTCITLFFMYSYFENGCRTKCSQQSRKELREIMSSLFFKKIWKNGTSDGGRMFASAKGKKQK